MSKKILLIENDATFATGLTQVLEQRGFDVRATGDGKQGLELAREWAPTAIVLCVELPGMSGYLVCTRLRKDDGLKTIPLVLTSADATADTFEKHKALKARADEYLLKPYEPAALLEVLERLVGLPPVPEPEPGRDQDEELVSLEEDMGLEALAAAPEPDLNTLDLHTLPEDPAALPGDNDETLALLDDAFDGLSAPEPPPPPPPGAAAEALDMELTGEHPVAEDDLDAAAASLPDEPPADVHAELAALDEEADAALGALGMDEPLGLGPTDDLDALHAPPPPADEPLAPPPPAPAPPPERSPFALRGASMDALRAGGVPPLDDAPRAAPAPTPAPIPAPPLAAPRGPDPAHAAAIERLERELAEHRQQLAGARDLAAGHEEDARDLRNRNEDAARRIEEAVRRVEEAESALAEKDVELAAARAKADAALAQAKRLDADLKASRDEARRAAEQARTAETELDNHRRRIADADRRGQELDRRAQDAERRAQEQERRAQEAERRAQELDRRAQDAEHRAQELDRRAQEAERRGEELQAESQRRAEQIAALEAATARHATVERELEEVRTELVVARGEAEGARTEVEKRTTELTQRISELEASHAKNEDRVLRAYQKIKTDEKVKEKVRKALAIAAQLLEDGTAVAPSAAAPQPPATPPAGRE